jgi:hypothetical protein
MIWDITQNHSPSTDKAILSNIDPITDRRSNADKTEIAYFDTPAQHDPRRKLSAIADAAVVID